MISGMYGLSGISGIMGLPATPASPDPPLPPPVSNTTFVATWNTSLTSFASSNSNQVALPLVSSGTYNMLVDWGDGSNSTITAWNQAEVTHTYSSAGVYQIQITPITGTISGWTFNNSKDKLKIKNISQWGTLKFGNTEGQFYGCQNLTCNAADAPDLSGTTSLYRCFAEAPLFNGAIGNWNTTTITSIELMFVFAESFNQSLAAWDTSHITTMSNAFAVATVFNGDITTWNTAALVNTSFMFESALAFNQAIGSWNMSLVTDMSDMFTGAIAFNQSLSSWTTSSATIMSNMFNLASSFNQNLASWDFADVTTMQDFFWGSGISTTNYSNLLVSLSGQLLQSSVSLGAGAIKYSAGAAATARGVLVNTYGWVITDGGQE